LILRVAWRSTHGSAAPKDLQFTFKPLWQMTPTEKATIAKSNAETVTGVYEAGLTKASTSLQELRTTGADVGLFGHITDEDIAEADEALDPPPGEDLPSTEDPAKPSLSLLPGGKGKDPVAPNPKVDPATKPSVSFGGDKKAVGDGKRK